MLPHTVRPDDIVEVINESNEYFGMIGKIVKKRGTSIEVQFYNNVVSFTREDLRMKARVGTSNYETLKDEIDSKRADNLIWSDYNDLIDHALDVGDYQWAYDLKQRRDLL